MAGYRAPYEPPRERQPERHVEAQRPGELVGMDAFFVGRLQGTRGAVWQLTAIDVHSSFAWAELVRCPRAIPPASKLRGLLGASPTSSARRAGSSSVERTRF